jgi:hypothetical protein
MTPVSEVESGRGEGEPKATMSALRQTEVLPVISRGLVSDCSCQSGFGSTEVGESTELVEFSPDVGKWSSMTLSEAGGGILMAPQTSCLSLCPVFTELVDHRQEECNLELVVFRSEEDEVGDYAIEDFPVEKQVES